MAFTPIVAEDDMPVDRAADELIMYGWPTSVRARLHAGVKPSQIRAERALELQAAKTQLTRFLVSMQ